MSTIVKEVKSFNFSTVTSLKTPHKRGKEVKVFYETASFLYLNIRKHYSPPSPTPPTLRHHNVQTKQKQVKRGRVVECWRIFAIPGRCHRVLTMAVIISLKSLIDVGKNNGI
jgi:hypothetical protein